MLTSLARGLLLPRATLIPRVASNSIATYGRVIAERRVFVSTGSRRAFSFTSPVFARTTVTRPAPRATATTATTKKKPAAATKKKPVKKPAAKKVAAKATAKPKKRKIAAKKKPVKKKTLRRPVVKRKVAKILTADDRLRIKKTAARRFLGLQNIPPTRGISPYMNFTTQYRAKQAIPGAAATELMKKAAAEWNALSDAEKNSYADTEAFALAKARYDQWKASKTMEEKRNINQARVALGKTRIFTSGLKEINSGYAMYGQHIRKTHVFEPAPEGQRRSTWLMKEIGRMWTALPANEKAPFNDAAEKLRQAERAS